MKKLLVGMLVVGVVGWAGVGQAAPTVTMTLSPSSGVAPYNTTLSWSSTESKTCLASDAWSGARALSGQVGVTVKVVAKFTLTCSVEGVNTLRWTPVTVRADGSVLTNLAGYKIYRGPNDMDLSTLVATITNAGVVSYNDPVSPGTYYYAMTAFDADGLESDFSTKVSVVTKGAQATTSVTTAITPPPQIKPAPPGGFSVTTSIGVQ